MSHKHSSAQEFFEALSCHHRQLKNLQQKSVEDQPLPRNYTYNRANELTGSLYSGVNNIEGESFVWDASGNQMNGYSINPNITLKANTSQRPLIVNNQYLEDGNYLSDNYYGSGKMAYRYDLEGNLIEKYDNASDERYYLRYDAENRLLSYQKNTGSGLLSYKQLYKYDGLGRRIEKQVIYGDGRTYTRHYIYDGENILLEYDQMNNYQGSYIGDGQVDGTLMMLRNGEAYFYHKDILGSVSEITSQDGELEERIVYSSFGKMLKRIDGRGSSLVRSQIENPFYYTGREYDDDMGVYYYRARYYNPEIGRFLTKDPKGFGGGDTNLYRYCGNNPINCVDPMGTDAIQLTGSVSGFYIFTGGEAGAGAAIVYDKDPNSLLGVRVTDFGFTGFVEGRAGLGAGASVGGQLTYTPGANSLSDLSGPYVSGGATLVVPGAPSGGISGQISEVGPSISFDFRAGFEASIFTGIGYQGSGGGGDSVENNEKKSFDWSTIIFWKISTFICFFATIPLVAGINAITVGLVPNWYKNFVLFFPGGLAAIPFFFSALKLNRCRCPKCNNFFHSKNNFVNPFAVKCLNCGLRIGKDH